MLVAQDKVSFTEVTEKMSIIDIMDLIEVIEVIGEAEHKTAKERERQQRK